jgi:hypothetical protein
MTRSNLHTIIGSLVLVYVLTLIAIHFAPEAKDAIEKLANLVLGGLLAIMRPSTQQVQP